MFTLSYVDVWQELTIATQPDVHVGRRGSVLSVCASLSKFPRDCNEADVLSAPLKVLGERLGLPVYTIPKVKKEFRQWPVSRLVTRLVAISYEA